MDIYKFDGFSTRDVKVKQVKHISVGKRGITIFSQYLFKF